MNIDFNLAVLLIIGGAASLVGLYVVIAEKFGQDA
jgi:hypothetical protein